MAPRVETGAHESARNRETSVSVIIVSREKIFVAGVVVAVGVL